MQQTASNLKHSSLLCDFTCGVRCDHGLRHKKGIEICCSLGRTSKLCIFHWLLLQAGDEVKSVSCLYYVLKTSINDFFVHSERGVRLYRSMGEWASEIIERFIRILTDKRVLIGTDFL
jgi:hypothetical protein